jgi:putative NADH-flavin reductase
MNDGTMLNGGQMKVLVLGGSGSIGRHVLEQGVRLGHQFSVLLRDPGKLKKYEGRVRLLQGDALDAAGVEKAVVGQEGVVYSLGVNRPGRTTLFSGSMRILIQAMEKYRVKRLVCITGVGAGETKGHGGFFHDRIIWPLFTRVIYEDKNRLEAMIRNSSLDWILVRPARFQNRAIPGELKVVTQVDGVTLRRVPRAEVAAFVLDALASDRYLRMAPFIGHA